MEGENKADFVDSALVSALSHSKNREIVLDFESRVLAFLSTENEALVFPLTLSGYQRLLAHRTAQHHGLQTETIADDSEDHGKIKATRAEGGCDTSKEKLENVPVVASSSEEQREAPKALKKKTVPDRPRPRENLLSDLRGTQERPHKPFNERNQNYERARERIFESYSDLHPEGIRSAHTMRNGSDEGSSELGKATFRNREQELRDPEFQRFRHPQPGMDYRFRPGMYGEEMDGMAHMMQGLSFGPSGPDDGALAYAQHPSAMAVQSPYGPMPVPAMGYGYQGPMMQHMPQGMGVYGSAGMPYGYPPQVPPHQYAQAAYPQQFMQPYPYHVSMRPANGVMQSYAGQQMAPNMMPFFQQQFIQQGYQVPGPGPHGGRPGFPSHAGPPRPQQAYQPRPLPSNGSSGYNRKSNTAPHRPVKSEGIAPPKAGVEADPAAASATQNLPSAAAHRTESLPPIKAPETALAPAEPQAEPAAKAGDKDNA